MELAMNTLPIALREFSHLRLARGSNSRRSIVQLCCNATGRIFSEDIIRHSDHPRVMMGVTPSNHLRLLAYETTPDGAGSKRVMNVDAWTCEAIDEMTQ